MKSCNLSKRNYNVCSVMLDVVCLWTLQTLALHNADDATFQWEIPASTARLLRLKCWETRGLTEKDYDDELL